MKKIGVLVLSVFMIFILTGCGEKKLSCTVFNEGNNMNLDSKVEYYFNGEDKVSRVVLESNFRDIAIDNIDEAWDSIVSQFTSQNEPAEEEGYKRTVSRDDKNYIFTVRIEVDFSKASKETLDKYGVTDISNNTYDEVKELSKEDGMKCE